jgi:hypothetical protein
VAVDPLDEVADRLYALAPDDFVPARDEAVATARQAGDRELAGRIAKLRRPTVGAWLVNLLAHECPDLVAELLQLGDDLRAAQRNLRGDDIRELSQRRRELVTGLASRAAALGRRRARGNLPLAEVQSTLTAALAEPEIADQVRAGRLTKTVSYAGFGEPPRPQLRVLTGGRADAPAGTRGEAPAGTRGEAPAGTRGEAPAGTRGEAPAGTRGEAPAKRRPPREAAAPSGRDAGEAERRDAERRAAEAERRAEEAERRAEEAERRAAEREAERAAERAAREQRRRERAAAHRELLAARTELAEAEAARAEAERAVTAARRRVEKATHVAAQLDAAED